MKVFVLYVSLIVEGFPFIPSVTLLCSTDLLALIWRAIPECLGWPAGPSLCPDTSDSPASIVTTILLLRQLQWRLWEEVTMGSRLGDNIDPLWVLPWFEDKSRCLEKVATVVVAESREADSSSSIIRVGRVSYACWPSQQD